MSNTKTILLIADLQAIYRFDFFNKNVEVIRSSSQIKRVALFFALTLLVFICIYVVCEISMLLAVRNYKKYSKQVFDDMPIAEQNEQVINYKPIRFIQDKLLGFFKKVAVTLAVFMDIAFLVYISATTNWGTNPFLAVIICLSCILGCVLLSIAAIAFVVWLSCKIRSIISDHKEPDIAKVRVRKIAGGKRDDQ